MRPTVRDAVDAHQHFADLRRFRYKWMTPERAALHRNFLPEDLAPLMERAGVTRTVLVQAHDSLDETRYLLELARSHPYIAAVIGWADLASTEIASVLDSLCVEPTFRGIRFQPMPGQDESLNDAMFRGLRELARRDLVLELSLRPGHLDHILALTANCDGLRISLNHMGMPSMASGIIEPWASDLAHVARLPNVYCKISAGFLLQFTGQPWQSSQLTPYVVTAIRSFGLDRCMWGSDWPVSLLAGSYAEILDGILDAVGPLSPPDQDRLLVGTATEFYRV